MTSGKARAASFRAALPEHRNQAESVGEAAPMADPPRNPPVHATTILSDPHAEKQSQVGINLVSTFGGARVRTPAPRRPLGRSPSRKQASPSRPIHIAEEE